ncbi:hypothetical protein BH11BAC3_BH11BAC3_33210 [soil metagenome]
MILKYTNLDVLENVPERGQGNCCIGLSHCTVGFSFIKGRLK